MYMVLLMWFQVMGYFYAAMSSPNGAIHEMVQIAAPLSELYLAAAYFSV